MKKKLSRTTEINWTQHTWNPIVGCSKISDGCRNCYACNLAFRLKHMGKEAYQGITIKDNNSKVDWSGKINLNSKSILTKPYKIKKASLIFVCSMSDFFHPNIKDRWRQDVLNIIRDCPHHIFQILTKRPHEIQTFLTRTKETIPNNVWLGVTVENNKAKSRIKDLKQVDARYKFLSIEPLLEHLGNINLENVNLVIVGGESGTRSRPMNVEWVRSIRDQCLTQDVKFIFKQYGNIKNNPQPNNIDDIGKGGSILDSRRWLLENIIAT